MKRKILTIILSAAAVGASASLVGAETIQRALLFETECLDLDADVVSTGCLLPGEANDAWDVLAAFHSDRAVHGVLMQNSPAGAEIAFLDGRTFEEVSDADVDTATFVAGPVDRPCDGSGVVLVRTGAGAVFKLGNPVEDDEKLTFHYALLRPAP